MERTISPETEAVLKDMVDATKEDRLAETTNRVKVRQRALTKKGDR